MSVSAATHSQILATAPAPKRLVFGQMGMREQNMQAQTKRAIQLLETAGGRFATQEQHQQINSALMEEFGLDKRYAQSLITGARLHIENPHSGSTSGAKSQPYQFASPDAAKDFARAKFDQLEYGVQNYNLGIKSWSVETILEQRQNKWQSSFEGRLRHNGGDEADAIAFAEKSLKSLIEFQQSGSGDYDINLALGGLQAFGPLPANLLIENTDGTLTINRDALKDTVLGSYLNIGSNIGQAVDRSA
jgi:hypothetical protein